MCIKSKPKDLNEKVLEICKTSKIIAVLTVHDENVAIPLAETILSGGLPVLEITLRTPNALKLLVLFVLSETLKKESSSVKKGRC